MSSATDSEGVIRLGRQLDPVVQDGGLGQPNVLRVALKNGTEESDQDFIDLQEYWNILIRRKATVIAVLAVAMAVALLATFLSPRIFRAEVLIQIDREKGKVLEYQNLAVQESINARDFYQTQYELLQSRRLAGRVIDQLGLRPAVSANEPDTRTPSFFGEVMGTVGDWIKGDGADVEKAPEPDMEGSFLGNLGVYPVKNSRLVRVSYDSSDPEKAAMIVNAVAENFTRMNLDRRYESLLFARKFLEEQTQQVRANLEDSERHLAAYARERGIINLDDRLQILMQKLKAMSAELIRAESERISAEAVYLEMKEEGAAGTASVIENLVVQRLKERKSELDIEYREQSRIYKPGYPRIRQLREKIDELDRKIVAESAMIARSVRTGFEAKVRKEAKIRMRIGEIKEEILALQDRSTDYQTFKREVDTNRQLYDGLLQRMKEVGVAVGIGANNISVVDAARVPRSPYTPNLRKNLAIALVLGLFGGVLSAFLSETMDDTVKSSEQIEKSTGIPVLGISPLVSVPNRDDGVRAIASLAYREPRSRLAEAFRSIRTSLVLATSEGAPRALHFTSASPNEGKTSAAVSTAITFARTGSKVLLIDADLRNPSLHKVFSLANARGLTNYLTHDAEPAQIALPTPVTGLFAITSGPLPPDPVELLAGGRMRDLIGLAREKFDYVIIDGPPVVGLADALVLADLAGASLFVVEAARTRTGVLESAIKRLRAVNARVIGCLLTKVDQASSRYYGYDYDYDYGYGYGAAERSVALPEQSIS
ncbi:MAG: polysaccharide biosynthesis tyrosine autokinase [Candidatus Thiosymbion ectosymbiont of Robbea hypermnestra]|nr:polysaccharide biosynthesis tyrosine autokinase [Candidatus Thiosymbion ectosymbiont of Robbea hypermnestra]